MNYISKANIGLAFAVVAILLSSIALYRQNSASIDGVRLPSSVSSQIRHLEAQLNQLKAEAKADKSKVESEFKSWGEKIKGQVKRDDKFEAMGSAIDKGVSAAEKKTNKLV